MLHLYDQGITSRYALPEQAAIDELRRQRRAGLSREDFRPLHDAVAALPPGTTGMTVRDGVVHLGRPEDLAPARLRELLETFVPWKKGPFNVCGTLVDGEWRSDLKWERLLPAVGSLQGQKVADIGCHNGYFMFRMAEHDPEVVVGFEPFARHWYTFHLLNHFAGCHNLSFELLGVEHTDLFSGFFDTIFCLGILYHHPDPVGQLRRLRRSLRKGGRMFIDCQGIPGDDPVSLTPARRYAGAGGIWFLPTLPALINWVRRAGFQQVETIYAAPLSTEEQRATPMAPLRSLADFLDPGDPQKTIEGYPAPWRYYLLVR